VSYIVVVLCGYAFHTRFTFDQPMAAGSFLRYALGMATNYPASLVLMFVFCDLAGLAVAVAAPISTVLLFVWNFTTSRWAIAGKLNLPRAVQMDRLETTGTVSISLDAVTRCLASRISLYRWRRPVYQFALLKALGEAWDLRYKHVLDVGGGTGIVAQAVKDLFPVDRVVSIDVENRYLEQLDIETRTYDGRTLPFEDRQFDCIMLCNVLHHVPKDIRVPLLKECGRVAGALYVKDHLAESMVDHLGLTVLDVIGNVPFGGMTRASYISRAGWLRLAAQAGFRITRWQYDSYRSGAASWIFPNRLEVLMTWESS
jgi:SAM-dependent methyltransferase